MNFDRTPPTAVATVAAPNWIEELGAKIADLNAEVNKLSRIEWGPGSPLAEREKALAEEIHAVEEMLSTCKPCTARDILIMAAVGLQRLDFIRDANVENGQKDFERDCALIQRTAGRIIPALEKQAAVTLVELGLDGYFSPPQTTAELIAAEKAEANDRKP
jgi:hypothetical protein